MRVIHSITIIFHVEELVDSTRGQTARAYEKHYTASTFLIINRKMTKNVICEYIHFFRDLQKKCNLKSFRLLKAYTTCKNNGEQNADNF